MRYKIEKGARMREIGLFLGLSFVLSACITQPKEPILKPGWSNAPLVFEQRNQWLLNESHWKLTAKIAIKTPDARESANLIWQRHGEENNVRLFGPLGAGSVKLRFNPEGASIVDSRGREFFGENKEALLESLTGWNIPLNALEYWLFALPDPRSPYQYVKPNNADMSKLAQLGWEIEFDKYASSTDTAPSLPRKIVAEKIPFGKTESKQASVRVIVKKWDFQ